MVKSTNPPPEQKNLFSFFTKNKSAPKSTSNNTKSSTTKKDSSSTTSTTATNTNKDTPVPSDTPPTAKHSSTASNEDTISLDVVKSNTKSSTDTANDTISSSSNIVAMADSTSTSTSMDIEDTSTLFSGEIKKENDTPSPKHSSTTTEDDTSSLDDIIMAYSTSTTITGDTSTFPSYLDDKEEVMEYEKDTSPTATCTENRAFYIDVTTGERCYYFKSVDNIKSADSLSEYLANTSEEEVMTLKQQMNTLKLARIKNQKDSRELHHKNRVKKTEEFKEYVKSNNIPELSLKDQSSIQANLLRVLTFADDELGILDTSHISCCYAGVHPPNPNEKATKETALLIGVDGDTSTRVKFLSKYEPIRKYVKSDGALFIKKNGDTLDETDLIIVYLRHEWLDPENQHKLEKYIKEVIKDAKQKSKIPIIVIAQHDIVGEQFAHTAEEKSLKTIQTEGFLSTEGSDYTEGSIGSPIALSFIVLGVGTVTALEEGRIFLSHGGTDCFKDEAVKRIAIARTDDSVWVFPKATTHTRKSKPDLTDDSPQTLPSELASYKGVDFTGVFAKSFSRALAQVELNALEKSFNKNGKTLLVVGTTLQGKESKTYTKAKENPDKYDMMTATEFMKFGFGKK